MRIENNTNYKNSFRSRNIEIRKADDIVRKINREYPGLSSTNFDDFHNIKKFPNVMKSLIRKIVNLRNSTSTKLLTCKDPAEAINFLPSAIKQHKIRNCSESAKLSCLGAKVNNIEDFEIASLFARGKGELDHAVVLVNNNGKPYIMDAWLGFADYVPNALERYKGEYRHHFNLKGLPDEKLMIFRERYDNYGQLLKNVSKEELCDMFPNLKIKSHF